MKLKQATSICKEMQKWRRGEGIYDGESPAPMPYTPETYGIALDKLIEHAEYKVDPMLAECLKRVDPDVRAEVRKKMDLTWQDVKRIVEIADDILKVYYFNNAGEEEYYTEVLRRFKEDSK